MKTTNLRWLTDNLDYLRIPLNASERAERAGDIPYWGANGIVDHVDNHLIDEPVVLIGEDGAPFFEPHKSVAFAVNGKIWPNNHIHILRPHRNKLDDRFLVYFLNCLDYSPYINGSTRDKLTQAQLGSIRVTYPDLQMQRAVADFLNRETARIDQLIQKKGRQVSLLAEKEHAIRSRCITKGLDSAVARKESHVAWLGEVPTHWSVKRLKHLLSRSPSSIKPGPFGSDLKSEEMADSYAVVLNQRAVMDSVFGYEGMGVSKAKYDALVGFAVRPGDLLITSRGTIGRAALVPDNMGKAIIHPCVIRIRLDVRQMSTSFASEQIKERSFLEQVAYLSNATTIEVIYGYILREVSFVVPPLEEQDKIVSYLGTETEKLHRIQQGVQHSISCLQEFRAALITAAVTGRIDVATWGKRGTTDRQLDVIEAKMAAAARRKPEKARA